MANEEFITIGDGITTPVSVNSGPSNVTIGSGDTNITIGDGQDTITAKNSDTIKVGNGADIITIGDNDSLTVGNGPDIITAGNNDKIVDGNGADTITAGTNSNITDGNGPDNITAGPNSTIVAGTGQDVVHAGHDSTITLGSGTDTVHAGTTDNITFVRAGQDTIDYDGLTPAFTVPAATVNVSEEQPVAIPITILPPSLGNEVINGFKTANGIIAFDTNDFTNASQVLADAAQSGANVVITQPGGGGTVTLTNTSLSSLTAANFAFFTGAVDQITISGVPTDATLSAGTQTSPGTWSLTPSQLAGLTLNAGEPTPVDSITVTMTNPAGQGATLSHSFPLQVHAIPPTVGVSVLPYESGDPVTETRLQLSSAVDSGDGGNDFINNIQLSNVPTGVSLSSPGNTVTNLGGGDYSISTTGNPASFNPEVDVFAPTGKTTDFSLGITANSSEPNGLPADETASTSQKIDVQFSTTTQNPDFQSQPNQSIWSSGTAFNTTFDNFLGVNFGPVSGSIGTAISIPVVPLVFTTTISQFVGATFALKAGFESDLHVDSGSFNGQVPFSVTLGNTYNVDNQALEVDPTSSEAGGGSFNTTFPNGSYKLDFILDAFAQLFAHGTFINTTIPLVNINSDIPLLNLASSQLHTSIPLPDGLGTVAFQFPNFTTTGTNSSPGTISSQGVSQPIFSVNIDPIAVVLDALIGSDPLKGNLGPINYTILAATVAPGIDVQQNFNLNASLPTGTINPDGGSSQSFSFGSPIIIPNSDGQYSLTLDPNVSLQNDTTLAGQLMLGLKAIAASIKLTVSGVGPTLSFGPLIHPTTTLGPAPFATLFNNTFTVAFKPTTLPTVNAT